MIESNEVVTLDSLKFLFEHLDKSIKNSTYGTLIKDHIRKKENIQVGRSAPKIKAIDINQQIVTLSQFRNNSVVLLDFWASWCIPCRQETNTLKDLYSRYHSKGFEIVRVSKDEDRDSWLSAIKNDSTEMWYHIPIAEKYALGPDFFTNDDIYSNYFVQAIPASLLIDKEGRIIGRWVGGLDSLKSKLKAHYGE